MKPIAAPRLAQQPGKPKPPGNPPQWPEPEPNERPDVPPPVEEPPPPIPPPPIDVPPSPVEGSPCLAAQASRGTGRGLRSASIAT